MTVPPDDITPLPDDPPPSPPPPPPPPPPPVWAPPGYGAYPPPPPGYAPPGYAPPGYAPPGYAPPGYGYRQSVNGMAIASLVLGVLWVYWIGSILALVFGYLAKRQIAAAQGRESGDGMATAGIVLGWIGVATLVLVILIGILAAASNNGT